MRILGRILLLLLALILGVVIFVVMYFAFSVRVGSDPKGARAERIKTSPAYQDGKFHNLEETDMSIPWNAMASVIWESLAGGEGRVPEEKIPTIQFNKEEWERVPDTAFAVAWFGHSTVLIKMDGLTFLCDPVFAERGSAFTFIGPKRFPYSHYPKLEELPHVDVVLLSHDHYDHLDHESVMYLKDKVKRWLMPLGVGAHLEYWGVPPEVIEEFDRWADTEEGSVALTLVPTRHFSGRGLTNRFSTLWGGWVIEGKQQKVLFGGDSGYTQSFKEIGERFGPFDLVMLECGAYNENWSNIHMFPEEVPKAATDLRAAALMPIHWAKFDLSLHPWKEPIERLTKAINGSNPRLFTPKIGAITQNADPAAAEEWWAILK